MKKLITNLIVIIACLLTFSSVYAAEIDYTFDYEMPSEAGWVQSQSGVSPEFTDEDKENVFAQKLNSAMASLLYGYDLIKTSDSFNGIPYVILCNKPLTAWVRIYQEVLPFWRIQKKDSKAIAVDSMARHLSVRYTAEAARDLTIYYHEEALGNAFLCMCKILPKKIKKKAEGLIDAVLINKDKKIRIWIRMEYIYKSEEEKLFNPERTVIGLASSLEYFNGDQNKVAYALSSANDLINEAAQCQASWTNEYWRTLYSTGALIEVVDDDKPKKIKFDRELYLHPDRAKEYLRSTIEYVDKVLAEQPKNADLYYAKAVMSEFGDGIDRYERSHDNVVVDSYTKAVDSRPDFEAAYYNMAIFYFIKKDYVNAIMYGNKALGLNKNSPLILFFLGVVYEKNNDIENALECYINAEKAWRSKEKKTLSNVSDKLKQKISELKKQKRLK